MWNDQSLQKLSTAANTFDRDTAAVLSADLIEHLGAGHALPARDAKSVVRLLRGSRNFENLKRVTEALMKQPTGDAGVDAQIRRQHAQALIELGAYAEARKVLQPLSADPAHGEWPEAKGLRGRSYKQEYINAAQAGQPPNDAILNAAIREYGDVYRTNPAHTWHGINAAAMIKRGLRDGLIPETDLSADAVAREILVTLQGRPAENVYVWDLATAAEARLALGDAAGALDTLKEYVSPDRKADAFEIASTLRQLEEVWQLQEDSAAGPLISVLRTALLQREGSTMELRVGELQRALDVTEHREAAFEKVFGRFGPQTLTWYRTGLTRASAVARVETLSGQGFGTGFLVRAGDFFPALAADLRDELLVMTNAHVLGRTDPGALRPSDAAVRFEALGSQQQTLKVKEIVWESPPDELDATIVRLSSAITGVEVIPLAPVEEPMLSAARPRRLYLVGHPLGGELAVSIEDNLQVGWKRPRIHYRTPSEPGSSGSPVFDEHWRLIALHHAGSPEMPRLDGPGFYEANEGIWIHEILAHTTPVAPAFESATPASRPALRQGVFVSYSHKDKKWLDELTNVLAPVVQGETLDVWDDRRIAPGAEWEREIEKAMERARVAVFLVSTPFLASGFITRKEMAPLLEASRNRGLTVFWVPVGAAYYEVTALAKLQAAWDPRRPLNGLSVPDRQAAWVDIAKKLVEVADLSRMTNALKLADQVVLKASGLGGVGAEQPSVTARQSGDAIHFQRGDETYQTITAAELGQLDPQSHQLIRAHEAALRQLFDEYTETYPSRVHRDPAIRAQAVQRIDELRRELCTELNLILDFIGGMGKQLDDHYQHVRSICGEKRG